MADTERDADQLASTLGSDAAYAKTEAASHVRTTSAGARLAQGDPDRYAELSELGRGGMGRVLLVEDRHLTRQIALKELLAQASPTGAASTGAALRFVREARVTGLLEHPNIVPVHELAQRADGSLYYTMKHIRGRSLAKVLREARDRESRLALMSAFKDVCQAVAYAHSRGVVHRDLKPDNVMVGEFGETLVVDWGIAKVRGESEIEGATPLALPALGDGAQTIDGAAIGTPTYMSPEQARGDLDAIDERSDVWSLGAMLFEILTGRTPFTASEGIHELVRRVREAEPPRVRDVDPEAPAELAAIADRALARAPEDRYRSAAELAAEIEAWQHGRRVRAHTYTSWELVRRFVAQNRAATIAAMVVAIAVLGASGLVLRSYFEEQRARTQAEASRDRAEEAQALATASAAEAQRALARALLERAERALYDGDPAAAAIYAAGSLRLDPSAPGAAPSEREVRALSLYEEAITSQRYLFEQYVEGAHHAGVLASDGRTLAIPGDGAIRLFDLETRATREVPLGAERIRALDGEGRAVVRASQSGLYDLSSGHLLAATPPPAGGSIARGHAAIATADGEVVVFDPSGHEVDRIRPASSARAQPVFSREGARLAITAVDSASVEIWDWPRTGAAAMHIDLPASPYAATFAPGGTTLAITVLDAAIVIASLEPELSIREIRTRGWSTAAAFDAHGMLATLEDGDRIVLRDVETGRAVDTLHVPASAGGRVETGGERMVYLAARTPGSVVRGTVFRRAGAPGRVIRTLANATSAMVLDEARERLVATTMRDVLSVALSDEGLAEARILGRIPGALGWVARVAVAPDGAIVVVTRNGALLLLDAGGSAPRVVRPVEVGEVRAPLGLAISPDGSTILTGSAAGGAVRRWSVARGTELPSFEGHSRPITAIAFSPDGSLVATGSLDGTVRVIESETGTLRHVLEGYTDIGAAVAFSPDGARLASADGVGHLWIHRVEDGALLGEVAAHSRWINSITWSSDGRTLLTAADDRSVRAFSAEDLELTRVVSTSSAVMTAAIGRGDTHLYYQDGRDLVRLRARIDSSGMDPETLLHRAEERAGVRLVGLELVPDGGDTEE